MYNPTIGIDKPYYSIRLTKEVKRDLLMWLEFMLNYNGSTIIAQPSITNSCRLNYFADASKLGFGATFG